MWSWKHRALSHHGVSDDEDGCIIEARISKKKAAQLAEDALHVAQRSIVANMRFMDPATFSLKHEALPGASTPLIASDEFVPPAGFSTDGTKLYYDIFGILSRCRHSVTLLTHDYMHVLLHCIFRHYYLHGPVRRRYWDIAVDVAVEELIASFHHPCFETPDSHEKRRMLEKLRRRFGRLSAVRLYRELEACPPNRKLLDQMEDTFFVDDHDEWYSKHYVASETAGDTSDGDGDDEDVDSQHDGQNPDNMVLGGDVATMDFGAQLDADEDWEKIADMVRTFLEMPSDGRSSEAGCLLEELRETHRRPVDYTTFLKKFASRRETMVVDEGTFDYIFYTYGMQLYGDMPLIEPLEYGDDTLISDLVIAIDTSGSTEGELVRSFIRKTFEILSNKSMFKRRFNVRIIQCDAAIQEVQTLHDQSEADAYLRDFTIKGMGGTDFRPVFEYVNALLQANEFDDLRGLLYFTDGRGVFPRVKPPYDTAFVFTEDVDWNLRIPPWAMRADFTNH